MSKRSDWPKDFEHVVSQSNEQFGDLTEETLTCLSQSILDLLASGPMISS